MADIRLKVGVLEPDEVIGGALADLLREAMPRIEVMLASPRGLRGKPRDCSLIVAGPGTRAGEHGAYCAEIAPVIKVLASTTAIDMADWARAGAAGFVLLGTRRAEMRLAVETVLAGGGYVSLPILAAFFTGAQDTARDLSVLTLTPREQEVLCYIALNMSNKDIARRLGLSVRTIETHRLHIRRKTGAGSRVALVQLAEKFGLLAPYLVPDEKTAYPAARGLHEDE